MIDSTIYGSLWGNPRVKALFDEIPRTQSWLAILATLAEVQAEFDLIPSVAAKEIESACRTIVVDPSFLNEVREGREASGHSMQGLIRAVQKHLSPEAAQWVYTGATVQDVTDTWLMLALREARRDIENNMATLDGTLTALARTYRDLPMIGRTHGQQGLPVTLGFKIAVWLAELRRNRQRLSEMAPRMDVVQLCGGVGSAASLGRHGLDVQRRFAQRLGLNAPVISWISSRDVLAEWCMQLTFITGLSDRIGHEIYNLQRTEIGELREGSQPGVVGSITMPHKRNPEISEHLGTLFRLVRHLGAAVAEGLVHDHERDGRSWKVEWVAIPESTIFAARAVELLTQLISQLEVDAPRMRQNLESTGGFVLSEAIMLSLASRLGRDAAHRILFEAAARARCHGTSLIDSLQSDPSLAGVMDDAEWIGLLDYAAHTGQCAAMVDSLLGESR